MKALTITKFKQIQAALMCGASPNLVKYHLQKKQVPARLAKRMIQYVQDNLAQYNPTQYNPTCDIYLSI